MSRPQAVTKATEVRYRSESKKGKAVVLDELCALTGWHREQARKRCAERSKRGTCLPARG